jgi:hypothetical protein
MARLQALALAVLVVGCCLASVAAFHLPTKTVYPYLVRRTHFFFFFGRF